MTISLFSALDVLRDNQPEQRRERNISRRGQFLKVMLQGLGRVELNQLLVRLSFGWVLGHRWDKARPNYHLITSPRPVSRQETGAALGQMHQTFADWSALKQLDTLRIYCKIYSNHL